MEFFDDLSTVAFRTALPDAMGGQIASLRGRNPATDMAKYGYSYKKEENIVKTRVETNSRRSTPRDALQEVTLAGCICEADTRAAPDASSPAVAYL
jgi:hypothetical protein